jgi:hypothetical protein
LQIRDVLPLRYNWLYYRLQQGLLKTDVHINATTEVLAQESAIRNDTFQLEIK